MLFLRTLLMFVFVFSLMGVSGSYAGKIKNCSNCESNKSQATTFGNNSKNQSSNQINFSDIECFFAFSDRAQCRVKRLSDLEICENIKKGRLSNVITEELFKNSLKEGKKRSLKCINVTEKSSQDISMVKKVIILAAGMKVNSKKGCLMDMVNILQMMEMCIKDNLKKISIMALENIILKMVNYTKGIGNMGNTMA